jgi:Flp pilus assembly protein TadG
VVLLLVTLVMGVVEFGRAWMVLNMITNAARDGARAAALQPPTNRYTSGTNQGKIIDTSSITSLVHAQIANVLGTTAANAMSVSVAYPDQGVSPNVTPLVQISVGGSVSYIFNLPLVGTSFAVNRSVTFRDEGR